MTAQYVMSHPETCPGMTSATSSQELEVSPWLSDTPVFPDFRGYGQEAALAPASPAPGREGALQTLVEGSGRSFIASSRSASLTESLGNRLRVLSATGGSMLYRLTWKAQGTPLGRRFYRLAASALRTRGNGSGGAASWQMPVAIDRGSGRAMRMLSDEARLAAWGTPSTMDSLPGGANLEERRKRGGCSNVKDQVFGTMSNGSPAVTGNGARLNPDLCRWLMGYPKEWDVFGGSATA